jgi:hypothetical protein
MAVKTRVAALSFTPGVKKDDRHDPELGALGLVDNGVITTKLTRLDPSDDYFRNQI